MRILAVLAAGRGERLKPLTETRPKALIPILDEPILCRHLRLAVERVNYDKVLVVVSYGAEKIVRELARCGADAEIVHQGGELGTGDAIAKAMEAGGPGDYTIIYGDIFLKQEVYDILAKAKTPSIMAAEVSESKSYGVVKMKPDNKLEGIIEKPQEDIGRSLVFAGVLKISYDYLKYFKELKPSPRGELEATDALTSIARQHDVEVVPIPSDSWLDIGRPWDLIIANIRALESEIKASKIEGDVSERAEIQEPVVIRSGSKIKAFTVIEGPAYIGEVSVIGPQAHIRKHTVVGKGAFIGAFTEVKASVILEGARLPHLNYSGDSIIGEYANLGAGTKIANFRFDEKTVRMSVKGVKVDTGLRKLGAVIGGFAKTGINVSIMPGVKIGSHAIIYPNCVVNRDVERGEVYNCWLR